MKKIISALAFVSVVGFTSQSKLQAQTETMTEETMQALAQPDAGAKVDNNGKKTKYDNNDPLFRDIAKEFRCPTCTGLSVLESDAGFSVQIKEQVQEQLNLGKNHDQII